jgi:hypothetical protein
MVSCAECVLFTYAHCCRCTLYLWYYACSTSASGGKAVIRPAAEAVMSAGPAADARLMLAAFLVKDSYITFSCPACLSY